MSWSPFGTDPEEHAVLVDGTPDWMLSSLRECFKSGFRRRVRADAYSTPYFENRVDRLRQMELQTRTRPFADMFSARGIEAVFNAMTPDERLRTLDWLIKDNVARGERGNDAIEQVLHEGGSKWKVGTRNGVPGLEERVPQGVQDAADATIASTGQAGQLLSEAWHATYGVSPDPEDGYEKAIKAVEAAGAHVVSPNNSRATLGTILADMKAQGDWKLPLDAPSADAPVSMAEALWKGQESRHGGNGYRKPSPAEAEAAVLLAVPLVQWFSSGVLARRP